MCFIKFVVLFRFICGQITVAFCILLFIVAL